MIGFHAAILFLSYLAFSVAVATGVLFLVQERKLKAKDPAVLARAAVPQELLDRVNLVAVVLGFSLFSVGMIQGLWLARREWGSYFSADPKELSSLITWAAYASVLGLRLTASASRGRRVVLLSVMSFLLVLFTFIGVNHLPGGRHVFF